MRQLKTERLILRPFRAADLADIHRLIYADPQVAIPYSGRTWPLVEMQDKFMERTQTKKEESGFLAVIRQEDEQVLGLVAIQPFSPDSDVSYMMFEGHPNTVGQDPHFLEAELTYALGRPFWHQGYATEACQSLIAYGFEERGIGRFVNSVISTNRGSIQLMQRLGFRIEKNVHPKPFYFTDVPGVIGILDRSV